MATPSLLKSRYFLHQLDEAFHETENELSVVDLKDTKPVKAK